jgi:hypothetical protein
MKKLSAISLERNYENKKLYILGGLGNGQMELFKELKKLLPKTEADISLVKFELSQETLILEQIEKLKRKKTCNYLGWTS